MLETIILTAFGGAMLFALEVVAFSMGVAVGREVAHKDADYMAEDDDETVFDPRAGREEYIGILNEAEARYTDALGWYIYLKMHREGPPHGTKRKGH